MMHSISKHITVLPLHYHGREGETVEVCLVTFETQIYLRINQKCTVSPLNISTTVKYYERQRNGNTESSNLPFRSAIRLEIWLI